MKLIDKKLYELTPKELRILNDKWNRYMCHNVGDGINHWKVDSIIDSYNHYTMTEFLINQIKTNYEINSGQNLMKTFFRHFDERGSYWDYVGDSFFYEFESHIKLKRFHQKMMLESFDKKNQILFEINDNNIVEIRKKYDLFVGEYNKGKRNKEVDECRSRISGNCNIIRHEGVVNEIKNMSPNELKQYMKENRYSDMNIMEKEITYTKIYNKDELTI